VLRCDTLRFLYANPAALANLQYAADELYGRSFTSIAAPSEDAQAATTMESLCRGQQPSLAWNTIHVRKNGSCYPIEFRLFRLAASSGTVIIAIGNDVSSRDESDKALRARDSRLNAVVSNTPGLVYQFLHQNGRYSFPYLSEGCEALLGLGASELQERPDIFLQLILPEDRPAYLASMQASLQAMTNWNWEGRIWIEKWNDVKWINLRATPRVLQDGAVQWEGIMTNITASKLEQEEIIRSRAQLAELSAHIDTVKEKERAHIAREIHDDLGGNLTAIKMALALLTRRMPQDDASLKEKADYVELLVDRTIETVHRIAGDLRPGILDFGLVAAIDWQAKEFEKQLGIPCHFSSNKPEIDLDLDHATALFRIFQEALTNIAKHAKASEVDVKLVRASRYVRLEVSDNGVGINAADRAKPKSFGIRGMVERSMAMGGSLSVSGAPKGGTIVAIRVPLR
jgi:two-component system sensor histidine kinase UhpB